MSNSHALLHITPLQPPPLRQTQASDALLQHCHSLPIKTNQEKAGDGPERTRKLFRSISGILMVHQKFGSISTPATNVPALEFSVSDSRAYYLG